MSSLESLLAEGVISEIYGRLKSGKEADVYAVCYGDNVVAAKVYKDRAQRSFKSNAIYKEGRAVRNSRSQRAMDRGTRFGKDSAEEAWKSAEANALYKLHAAGVRVPVPVLFLEGVLFMELVRGADGQAAPRLIDTEISPAQARSAYLDMLSQLVRILSCDLIHGDLSPYNVLWAVTGPTIIDFPQIVSAAQNNSSEALFLRDARNILGYFAALDPSLRGRLHGDAREIWRAYVRRELSPDFLPTGQPARPEPQPRFVEPARHATQPRGGSHQPGDSRGQSRHSPAPRLQMASATANIASRSGEPPSRSQREQQPQRGQPQRGQQPQREQQPQRGQQPQRHQRGPEVIVLRRRAPESPAVEPREPEAPAVQAGERQGGSRRRRRR